MQSYAKDLWVTGISVLDAEGHLLCEYTTDGVGYAQIQKYLNLKIGQSVAAYPQKTYTKRVWLVDDSFVDVAAHGRTDAPGILLAYRHTPSAFSEKSILSIQSLLDGYSPEETGTVLIAEGNHVLASNNTLWLSRDLDGKAFVTPDRLGS